MNWYKKIALVISSSLIMTCAGYADTVTSEQQKAFDKKMYKYRIKVGCADFTTTLLYKIRNGISLTANDVGAAEIIGIDIVTLTYYIKYVEPEVIRKRVNHDE